MSDRITQYRNPLDYTRQLGILAARLVIPNDVHHPRYNVGPGSCPFVVFADCTVRVATWERADALAALPLAQAVAETRLAPLWRAGRVLVPVDGWYAVREEDGRSTPCFVHPRDNAARYIAALSGASCPDDEDACFTPLAPEHAHDAQAEPPFLMLDAATAARWLDRRLCYNEAQQILAELRPDADTFEWRPVAGAVDAGTPDTPGLVRAVTAA